MAGWHHWLDGRESEWTAGVGDGQGGLACCDSWGRKESDTAERLNWTELNWIHPTYSLNVVCHVLSMSDSLWSTRLLCPWDFAVKNTRVMATPSSRGLPTQRSNISCVSCIASGFFIHWTIGEVMNVELL